MLSEQVDAKIRGYIEENKVLLFMKGTKEQPMCGFSSQVVQILNHYKIDFQDVNILEDMDIREGIKVYSSWPTIPQLYVKKKFIGGCDIIMELHRNDQLKDILL